MKKKLLLADDSITIQKVIGIIFATEDYDLLVCDDGNEAFEKALAEYPDLVIADISMPGKDGFELCQAIKSESRLGHTSVLLLPGTFDHFDESRAEAVGADGWISKPFESQALLDKVAQLIDAEPVCLSSAEEVPGAEALVEGSVDFTVDDVADEVVTDAAEELPGSQETAVYEVVLGLDEVDELDEVVAEIPVEEESADDIWDAVSFEEEDLQQPENLSSAVETDLAEEFVAVDEVEESPVEENPAQGSDLVLADGSDADEPLELTDEVSDALELDATGDEPLELEAETIVTAADSAPFEVPAIEDVSVAPVEEPVGVVDFSAEELSVVEPLDEDSLDPEEEILDLSEGDILEEAPSEEIFGLAPEFVDDAAVEETSVIEEEQVIAEEPELAAEEVELVEELIAEPIADLEPEVEVEPEATEDEGFYYDATEPQEAEALAEPVVAIATGVAVLEETSVEQVEQQLRELSEDELKEVVAKVAGSTIEKLANEMLEQIVWEVVPDLAESMIREEIRKIRQGAE